MITFVARVLRECLRVWTRTRLVAPAIMLFVSIAMVYGSHPEIMEELQPKKRPLIYTPRGNDVRSIRRSGISRSSLQLPSLYALAPGHTGCTISEQPTLYWYQSYPCSAQFELTIIGKDKTKPVFRKIFDSADWSGIQKLELGDHRITLSKKIQYTWTVSIVPDPDHRSKDMIANGIIERIDPPGSLASSLVRKSQEDLVYILSEKGIWYDALEKITQLIESHPTKSEFRELRAELLDQVGLSEVAEYDREVVTPPDKQELMWKTNEIDDGRSLSRLQSH